MRYGFICFALLLCCLHVSTTARSQLQKIYLLPKTIARENQSKFVDSIRFIPLEIKAGLNLGSNNNINVTSKYILLTDYSNKKMVVYLKDGKFVKTIDYKRFGEGFYPRYVEQTNKITFFGKNKNYSLTPKDQVKIKLDWNNARNKKYFKKYSVDLNDPTFSIQNDLLDEKDIVQINHLYDNYFVQTQIEVSPLYKDSADYELKLYKNNELVQRFFPYNPISEPRFLYSQEVVSVNKTDSAHIHIFTRPYSDTIYKMLYDSLFPAYQLVLPLENTLPASFYKVPFKNKTERDNFNRNNGWVFHQVYNFYENSRFINFLVAYLSNYDSYIYDKQTNLTYKSKNIRSDSSQYNLQLFSNYNTIIHGGRLYKPQKAADLLAFFEQYKNIPVPKELEAFLKSKPSGNTPVIVEFKFKN